MLHRNPDHPTPNVRGEDEAELQYLINIIESKSSLISPPLSTTVPEYIHSTVLPTLPCPAQTPRRPRRPASKAAFPITNVRRRCVQHVERRGEGAGDGAGNGWH
ncbi:hypothetical protein DPSP01_000905 [Paraphaeosphaeria sporulosa]